MDALVDHHLSVLDVAQQHKQPHLRELTQHSHPFLPIYQELPAMECGYAYLLVSMACPSVFHVGLSENIKKALHNISKGYGDIETRDTDLHPWGVFAFIVGFETGDAIQQGITNRTITNQTEFTRVWKNSSIHQCVDGDKLKLPSFCHFIQLNLALDDRYKTIAQQLACVVLK